MKKIKKNQINFIRRIINKDLSLGKYKKIYTRFPPEPNGYLHIGHAKAICLNFEIAQDYNGQCNLRFDDTNPVNENLKYIKSIKDDINWLGFNFKNCISYSSDYFEQLYNYALELINKGLAYVDHLSSNKIREYRGTLTCSGKNSPYRNRSIEENIFLFTKMRNGKLPEGSACLRAKIDMSSPFLILRDPVLYRIKFIKHHQTGNKWCIYAMYDFTHCIVDALEGITHSLCTLEFQDNRRLYEWILNNITINTLYLPRQYEFSRLNLEYTVLSKRELSLLVSQKIVDDWDDPRMPTISGLRRRGYTAASIREFCRRIGITKQNNNIEMSILESCIREDLNKIAPRVMAVINPVLVIIESLPEGYEQIILMPNHPVNSNLGTRKVIFSREIYIDRADFKEKYDESYKRLALGKEVRLRNACIIRADSFKKNIYGQITTIFCKHDPDTFGKNPIDNRKIKGVIHWVSALRCIKAEFRLYDKLFNIKKPDLTENIFSILQKNSLIIRYGFIENFILLIKNIKHYQFEREGYFCIDYNFNSVYPVFNRIVKLKEGFKIKK